MAGALFLISMIALLAIPLAFIVLIIAAVRKDKRLKQICIYMLLIASIVLLVSFTLCSTGIVKNSYVSNTLPLKQYNHDSAGSDFI
ncbi:MAG: hypothetical protein H7257_10105 [Taibaiella sp.]|nr:hypothetical protein [Taibaiella sp.]